MWEELENVAKFLGGELKNDGDGWYVYISTDDNTSNENYDDMLGTSDDIKHLLTEYKVSELWADHNTQIVEFEKK